MSTEILLSIFTGGMADDYNIIEWEQKATLWANLTHGDQEESSGREKNAVGPQW